MVFVSLEGFLAASVPADKLHASGSSTGVPVPHALQLPQAPVYVVVTPGSPVKQSSASSASSSGQKRSRLLRATSAFSSFSSKSTKHDQSPTDVTAVPPPAMDSEFVVYVTDRDVHHKWVLTKTQADYTAWKKSLQASIAGCKACPTFACCGPLRRIVASSQYKKPKRRWSESRVVTQFGRCSVVQEFLNDLLLAVLRRDTECDATRLAWDAVASFLDVQIQRSDVADKIVLLRTVGGEGDHREGGEDERHQHFRRSVSEQLPSRSRTRTGSGAIVGEQHAAQKCCPQADATDSETESSDQDEEAEHDTECSICCAGLEHEGALKTAKLLCGHSFHAECVRVWLRMQHTCPVCRIPIEGM